MRFSIPEQPTNAMLMAFIGVLLGMWLLDTAYRNRLVRERMEKLGDESLVKEFRGRETMTKIFGWVVTLGSLFVLYQELFTVVP